MTAFTRTRHAKLLAVSLMARRCSTNAASFTNCRVLADKARSELKGEEKRAERKQLLEQASTIYQAESAAQARERLTKWADQWRERAPKAVATLERDG